MSDNNLNEDGNERREQGDAREQGPTGSGWEEYEPDEGEYFEPVFDSTPGADELPPRYGRRVNSEQEKIYRREGAVFRHLARDLSHKVAGMEHHFKLNGMRAEDVFFCLLMRAYYHNLSARRLDYELKGALRERLISRVPSPNAVLYHLRHEWLTPLLREVIALTAFPFRHRDRRFAVDSTKIYTAVYRRGGDGKVVWQGGKPLYKWIKLHIMCGLTSLSVVSARVTQWTEQDIMYLRPLLDEAVRSGFVIRTVAADRGYAGKENHQFIHDLGAEAYIIFKHDHRKSRNGSHSVWDANLGWLRTMRGPELEPHHERILIQAVKWMIRSRFRRVVRGITEMAQFNEALLKVVCHNLTRLNQYGIGLDDEDILHQKS